MQKSFHDLEELGTEGAYPNIVKTTYSKPRANVTLNREKLKAFPRNEVGVGSGEVGVGRWRRGERICCTNVRTGVQIPRAQVNGGELRGLPVIPALEGRQGILRASWPEGHITELGVE